MKNQSIVIIIGLGIVVVGAVVYSFNTNKLKSNPFWKNAGMEGQMQESKRMTESSSTANPTTPPKQNNSGMGMMAGMDNSMKMVTSERQFLEEMIPHHQEAVDSAKVLLARGGSTPEIKKLAEDIIGAQEKEIAMMKSWYQDWYGVAYAANPAGYKPMMRDLSTLSGAALDKVFLEDMIMHHMGAIMTAQSVQPYIKNKEITDLTKAIIETQTEEINVIKRLLTTLQ